MSDREDPPYTPPLLSTPSKDERNWALFLHLSQLLHFTGVPLGGLIAPLVIWIIKKEEMPFINESGKEVINFQISLIIYAVISFLLIFVIIGFVLLVILGIGLIVFSILGAIKASEGTIYRYPLTIRMIT